MMNKGIFEGFRSPTPPPQLRSRILHVVNSIGHDHRRPFRQTLLERKFLQLAWLTLVIALTAFVLVWNPEIPGGVSRQDSGLEQFLLIENSETAIAPIRNQKEAVTIVQTQIMLRESIR